MLGVGFLNSCNPQKGRPRQMESFEVNLSIRVMIRVKGYDLC